MTGPLTRPIVEAFESLSPQLQTAARYVLDRPDDVALLSMREQARRAGVPPATMTRLAQRLGLEGYDEVRALYAGAVRDGTLGFAGKAGVQVEAQKLRGEQALASDMVQSLSRQIARLAEPAALERLADAAGRLHEARRIYCLGLRSCHAAAWHFHYMLSLLGDKTVMLDDAGGTGLDALRDAGREDILLAASVEPYARATIEAARYAAAEGVPVVALTDSEVSPLAQIASATILVATDSPSFFHSMTPLLAVAEILAALVAGRSGQKALDALTPHRGATRRLRCPPAAPRLPGTLMTHILHRTIGGSLPVAASGKGIEIVDAAGKHYLDASGGAAVSCLGHGHPAVTAALHEQLDKLAYAHTSFFTTEVAEQLADTLIADAPAGIGHVYLVSGGSEAIEAALKMARQYFTERGETAAAPHHRAPPELSRQHAGRAGGRRQRMAPRAFLAAPDRDAPYRSRASPIASSSRARARRPMAAAPPMRWRRRSSSWAATRSWPSSPRRWSARPPARCRRPGATSSACGRFATSTACC